MTTPTLLPGINNVPYVAPGLGKPSDPAYAAWWSAMNTDIISGRADQGDTVVFAGGDNRVAGVDLALQPIPSDPRGLTIAAVTTGGSVAPFSTPGAALLTSALAASGTAQAASGVAGVIGAMLTINPDLGWRDIQEIIAISSMLPSAGNAGFIYNKATGWNGGGMHFSNDLGFGVLNQTMAENLAQAWPTENWSDSVNVVFEAITQAALTADFPNNYRIQHVQVTITDTGLLAADTTLTLTSPEGTTSTLLTQPPTGTYDLNGAIITSNAFWGEYAEGVWTLGVANTLGVSISSWTLSIWGDTAPKTSNPAATATPYSVITPEFNATTLTPNGKLLYLASLPGTVNINLNGGPGVLNGVNTTLGAGFSSCSAVGCTGNVTIVGSGSGTITGGSGTTNITVPGECSVISGPAVTNVTATAGANIITANNLATSILTVASVGGDFVYACAGWVTVSVSASAAKKTTVLTAAGKIFNITAGQSETFINGIKT